MSSKKLISSCLLIDDDTDDREIFREVVTEYYSGIKCFTASGCAEAFALLREQNLTPDAIFLDLNMPRVNGRQCLVNLKQSKEFGNVPVVIYSTSSQPKDVNETLELGAAAYITKQSDINALVNKLKPVLEKA